MARIWCGRLLTPDTILSPAVVETSDGLIREVREPEPGERHDLRLEGTVLPAYVDLQVNGMGSHSVADADPRALGAISEALLAAGVTAWLPTIVTCPEPDRIAALDAVAEARTARGRGARILGAHLEGPWISPARAGAHRVGWVCEPVAEVVERSLTRHEGLVRLVTFAPEVAGASDLLGEVLRAGAVASLGHTNADHAQASAAIAAGARMATHLFNAMRPPHHRDPGIVGAVLDDALVTASLICDGVHLHDVMVRLAFRAKGWERMALVSDAVATRPDGTLRADALAGSRSTLGEGVSNAVRAWVPLEQAAAAASLVPSRLLGVARGRAQPGSAADLVMVDDAARPVATVMDGALAWER